MALARNEYLGPEWIFFLFFFEFQVNIVEEAWDESQLNKEKCVCIFIFFNGLMKFKLFYNQLIEKSPVSFYSFHRERETENASD